MSDFDNINALEELIDKVHRLQQLLDKVTFDSMMNKKHPVHNKLKELLEAKIENIYQQINEIPIDISA